MTKKSPMTPGFTLIELMIVVAIIGVLSTVAIPSFMKYIRRSKTAEAIMNTRKLYEGAMAYFEAQHTSSSGANIAKQFPDAVLTPVPALGTCCSSVGQKCAPSQAYWVGQTWQAMNFSMDDPHYYSYSFVSTGVDSTSVFDAVANGDLDCNATYSTFSRHGSIDSGGNVTGSSGIYSRSELE